MKNSLLLLVFFLPIAVNAQFATDDFESYNTGAFDGQYNTAQWEGWLGNPSRAVISTDQAHSGTNSMRVFDDLTSGAETDIIAFLGTLDTGVDTISFWQYIDATSTGAYYNLQHNYTGVSGDWAAEVYFGIDTGYVQTDGTQFPFTAKSNQWVEQMFILDFTNTTGLFYYDGNLVHTWALNTNAAGGAGLNQINAINFYSHDNATGTGSNAYYDDVNVLAVAGYDVEITTAATPSPYTQLTNRHLFPMTLSADITNIGGSDVTNVAVVFDVLDGSGTSVYSETVTQATLAAGATSTFSATGTYIPSATGNFTINYDVSMTETDSDLSNNSGSFALPLTITDSTHAKDDGNIIDGVGFSGVTGHQGHIYEFLNKDSISSVDVGFTLTTAGDIEIAHIYNTQNGAPTGTPIASSAAVTMNGDTALSIYNFDFATPVPVDSGASYMIALEQTNINGAYIGYTFDMFTPNTGYYSLDGGATWTRYEDASFFVSVYIRPNVTGNFINPSNKEIEPFEGVFDIMPNPTRGLTTLNVEIEKSQDIQVAVFDMTGRLVQAFNDANVMNRQYTIDLSNQADGVYLVRLVTNGQMVTKRVVLNK